MNEGLAIGPDARAETLVARYEGAGYRRVAPALLQPAEPFLDLSGEDIRRRMFLTTDPDGNELCLRPDLTIPVSRDYLASPDRGNPMGFCYLGPVFRHRAYGPAEFWQAGIESFGRTDTAETDAEIFSRALEAASHYGIAEPAIRIGDVGLFAALVSALNLAPAWQRRLIKHFNRAGTLAADLDRLVSDAARKRPEYQGVLSALARSDRKAAHALVTDLLSIAGITAVGGRSVGEIADRFLEQASLDASAGLPQETRVLIERFLSIAGDPDESADALRTLAREANLSIDAALDLFEERIRALEKRSVDLGRIHFSTAHASGWDYYTGFVFRLHDAKATDDLPLVAGGRYDGMLSRLGSPVAVPAIGLSVWIDRLAAAGGAP